MAKTWWDRWVTEPALTAIQAGSNAGKAIANSALGKLVGKTLYHGGNYFTGDAIGKNIGTIVGADNPDNWGIGTGLAYAALMPRLKQYGAVFDGGYALGELADEATGASKFWSNWLSDVDPFGLNAETHDYRQDNDYIVTREKLLAKRRAQQDAIKNVAGKVIGNATGTINNIPIPAVSDNPVVEGKTPVNTVNYDDLVASIIRGDHDNGIDRIRKLQSLGYSLDDIKNIQGLVNNRIYTMRGGR